MAEHEQWLIENWGRMKGVNLVIDSDDNTIAGGDFMSVGWNLGKNLDKDNIIIGHIIDYLYYALKNTVSSVFKDEMLKYNLVINKLIEKYENQIDVNIMSSILKKIVPIILKYISWFYLLKKAGS